MRPTLFQRRFAASASKVGLFALGSALSWLQARAQTSPTELAQAVVRAWATGSETEFAALYPFREGRESLAVSRPPERRAVGLARVIRTSPGHAVLLLSGVPQLVNSGAATAAGRGFSSVYEAHAEGEIWKLDTRVPSEILGSILAHHLKVAIHPASGGLAVEDRMRIQVSGPNGFAARLNHVASIKEVLAAAGKPGYLFGGGLFWVDLPAGENELTLRYSIDVEKGPADTNSGCFLESAGHVRNQYFWHPCFDFNSIGDWADFQIEVRIPKEYEVSTSIPQTMRLDGADRIIEGATIRPASTLTLVYDREWQVERQSIGDVSIEFFVTPQFQPDRQTLADEIRLVTAVLAKRFGALPGGYVGVVQARSWSDNPGWRFASNQVVVSAATPGLISIDGPAPNAPFGHEIAHIWMDGASGPAMSFLTEGWAVWAESQILERKYGAKTAADSFRFRAADYLVQYDGKASLLADDDNNGVAYFKGPWLFRMLEDAVGSAGFEQALAEYSARSRVHRGGWEMLAECLQHFAPAGFDARTFMLPWLAEKSVPHLTTQVQGRRVTIRQEPPYFVLPVVVEATTAAGPERQRVWLKGSEVAIVFSGDAAGVKIDPDERLLLRR